MERGLQFSLGVRIGGIIRDAGIRRPPVDLFKVAIRCGVRSILIREMIPRGGLECIEGGFNIYIRGEEESEYVLPAIEPPDLTTRQRFSLAHELAHSLYYVQRGKGRPTLRSQPKNGKTLETLCDENAAKLIVPVELLRPKVAESVELCHEKVVALAQEFRASPETVLRQIGLVGCSAINRAVLLVEPTEGGADVRASWVGTGLMSLFSPPREFHRITREHPVLGDAIQWHRRGEWEKTISGRTLKITRTNESGKRRRYFIEAVEVYTIT